MDFDSRVYGNITMPAGNYEALRVTIGEAEGHNWWCVMYPPLCIPAAETVESDDETAKEMCIRDRAEDVQSRAYGILRKP